MFFEDQHAIITGGSSGIGFETAKQMAQLGARLTLIARSADKLAHAREQILALDSLSGAEMGHIATLQADVSDKLQAREAVEEAICINGPPDILLTSAGMCHPGYFRELPLEIFERTMAVNYFGTLYSIKAVLPAMEARKKGHVALISSGVGLIGTFGYTPYSPTKFALRGLAECLRGELKQSGISVSIIYPPDTDTPQLATENQTKPPETFRINATVKMWQPEDVATEIIKGLRDRKFVVTPGLEMKILARFHRLMSPILHWYFDQLSKESW